MEVISFVPGSYITGLILLIPSKQKAVWAPETVWTICPSQEPNHSSTDTGPEQQLCSPRTSRLHFTPGQPTCSRRQAYYDQSTRTSNPEIILTDGRHILGQSCKTKDAEELPLPDHKSIQMVYLTLLTLGRVSTDSIMEIEDTDGLHTLEHLPSIKTSSYHLSFGSET